MPKKIEISHRSVIFAVLFVILLWILYLIKDILLIFFVALLIMTVLNPMVRRLSKLKIPRPISVVIVFFLMIGVVVGTLAGIVPPLIEQTTNFANNLPVYLNNLGLSSIIGKQIVDHFISQLSSLSGQALKFGLSIFSNILSVISVLIFAFYLLMSRDKLDDQIISFLGTDKAKKAERILNTLEYRLGGWARGQLTMMLFVGVLSFIGLYILKIPYALPLALLAGLFEIVPQFGPIIAAVPAAIIGFGISPVVGVATIALAILIQQVENYVLVPKIMEKSIGVSPIITLLSIAIGLRLAGVVGVLISVPVLLTGQVLLGEFIRKKEAKN